MATAGWVRSVGVSAGAALCILVGCGARAMLDSADASGDGDSVAAGGRGGSAGTEVPNLPGSGAGGSTPPVGSGGDDGVDVPAQDCADSFQRSDDRDRACPYINRGLCYESGACACAFSCSTDSQCVIDGFLEPDEPQRVRCISP